MLEVKGFHFKEQINESNKAIIYRGIREKDNLPVIVQLFKSKYLNRRDFERIENGYITAKALNISGMLKPYGLEETEHGKILVFEDTGGVILRDYIYSNAILLKDFFEIAINLTAVIEDIHHQGFIHKNINPANILLDPETKEIKIIDFGITTHVQNDAQPKLIFEDLQGTLAYMSPEQTGRMNLSVDFRTDLYSLGVTLYEIMTGRLPEPRKKRLSDFKVGIWMDDPQFPPDNDVGAILSNFIDRIAVTGVTLVDKKPDIDLKKCHELRNAFELATMCHMQSPELWEIATKAVAHGDNNISL